MSDWFKLAIGILATWRLTHMVYTEGGPFHVFDHFREFFTVYKNADGEPEARDKRNQIGAMISCFWCLSWWCGLAFAILLNTVSLPWIFAFSAGALFLGFTNDRLTYREPSLYKLVSVEKKGRTNYVRQAEQARRARRSAAHLPARNAAPDAPGTYEAWPAPDGDRRR